MARKLSTLCIFSELEPGIRCVCKCKLRPSHAPLFGLYYLSQIARSREIMSLADFGDSYSATLRKRPAFIFIGGTIFADFFLIIGRVCLRAKGCSASSLGRPLSHGAAERAQQPLTAGSCNPWTARHQHRNSRGAATPLHLGTSCHMLTKKIRVICVILRETFSHTPTPKV